MNRELRLLAAILTIVHSSCCKMSCFVSCQNYKILIVGHKSCSELDKSFCWLRDCHVLPIWADAGDCTKQRYCMAWPVFVQLQSIVKTQWPQKVHVPYTLVLSVCTAHNIKGPLFHFLNKRSSQYIASFNHQFTMVLQSIGCSLNMSLSSTWEYKYRCKFTPDQILIYNPFLITYIIK